MNEFFGNGTTVNERLSAAALIAGIFIRYGFYLVAAIVMGGFGLAMLWFWNARVTPVETQPAFRIDSRTLSGLPVTTSIVKVGHLGRVEIVHYGAIHNRETDLTAVLFMPPKGAFVSDQMSANFNDVNLLHHVRHIMSSTYHDLETRFGSMRAVEMRVETDGRWKQCLAYRSRFDQPSIFLMGWYCDGTGTKPGAHQLACTLDKLTLNRELTSQEADAFMRSRMAKSATCSADPVSQTTDTSSRRVSPPSRWSRPSASTSYRN